MGFHRGTWRSQVHFQEIMRVSGRLRGVSGGLRSHGASRGLRALQGVSVSSLSTAPDKGG